MNKLGQALFSQGIDQASIEQLVQTLKDSGVAPQAIDDITNTLKQQMTTTKPKQPATNPAEPPKPPTPGTPDDEQQNTVQQILQPGKKLSCILRVCDNDLHDINEKIEDVIEELMDKGIDPDTARLQAKRVVFKDIHAKNCSSK